MSLRRAVLGLGFVVMLVAAASAHAQGLAPDLEVSIAAAAEADRVDQARRMALARSFGDTGELQRLEAGTASGQFSELTVTLVQAIASRPQQVDAIIAAALRAAPQSRSAVLNAVAMHFPGHLDRARGIAAGAPIQTAPTATVMAPPAASPLVFAPTAPPAAAPAPLASPPATVPSMLPTDASRTAFPRTAPPAPPREVMAATPPLPSPPPVPRSATEPMPRTAPPPPPRRIVRLPASPAAATVQIDDSDEADTQAGVASAQFDDPWEGFNRRMFAVHDGIDRVVLRPLAVGYGAVMPEQAQGWIRNAFDNLKGPVRFANDLLQGDFEAARTTAERFVFNSVIGVAGLFDPATDLGLERQPADFGQTLHRYGVRNGPYLFIPVLGPTTVRDGVGQGVDSFFSPLTYVTGTLEGLAIRAGNGVTFRETLIESLDDLRANSVDYYAAIRSIWYQDRARDLSRDTSK